ARCGQSPSNRFASTSSRNVETQRTAQLTANVLRIEFAHFEVLHLDRAATEQTGGSGIAHGTIDALTPLSLCPREAGQRRLWHRHQRAFGAELDRGQVLQLSAPQLPQAEIDLGIAA